MDVNEAIGQAHKFFWAQNFDAAARIYRDLTANNCYLVLADLGLAYCLASTGRAQEAWDLTLTINSLEKIRARRDATRYTVGFPDLESPPDIVRMARELATKIFNPVRGGIYLPVSINFEMTNACNAKCFMCPATTTRRPLGRMPDHIFQLFVEQVKELPILPSLSFHGVGEPLVDKRLVDRLAILKSMGHELTLVTNGSLLNEQVSKRLLEINLNQLNVSIETLDPKLYEEIRVGLKFDVVRSNLANFLRLRNEAKSTTAVGITVVLSPRNPESAFDGNAFLALGLRKGDWIQVVPMHNFGSFFKFNESFYEPGQIPCDQLFGPMNIGYDGTVMLCCVDSEYAEPLGNIARRSILELYNSDRFKEIREAHLNKRRHEIAICRTCDYPETMLSQKSNPAAMRRFLHVTEASAQA